MHSFANTPDGQPRPMRTSDTAFTRDTMGRRVPGIIRSAIAGNPSYLPPQAAALEALAAALESNAALPAPSPDWPDAADWQGLFAPHAGETWLDAEWFFAEIYVYRLLLAAVRYDGLRIGDPFAFKKLEEADSPSLPDTILAGLSLRDRPIAERLSGLLHGSLWGNRMDLSLSVAASLGVQGADEDLIADDRAAVIAQLTGTPGGHVHVVADNAGTELALDLVLVDALLDCAEFVTLHLKHAPMFVSDAMSIDLQYMFNTVLQRPAHVEMDRLAHRLASAGAEQHRLTVTSLPVWNTPRFGWQLTPDLLEQFAAAKLVIFKGDLNYRRLVGDAVWPPATPFAQAVGYFPGPVLALRTLKSEPIAGLAEGAAEALDAEDPNWRLNGRRGVIQFKA